MAREMRRQERVLDESRTQSLLLSGEYGVLSTTSIDGDVYIDQAIQKTKILKLTIDRITGKGRQL